MDQFKPPYKPTTLEYIFDDYLPRVMPGICKFVVRIVSLVSIVWLIALPLKHLPDPATVTFWYSLGAYGLFLMGVSSILNRLP